MLIAFKRSQGSIILRVKIRDSSVATGAGKTGLAYNTSGLIISTIADNESSPTSYTVAGSTIEDITTLGTFAAPTATKCRFKEVDATNHKGIYELQIADARFAVSSAKSLLVSISGATNAAECDVCIPLTDLDPYDSKRAGLLALPNANAEAAGGLYTRGTGAGQINQSANGQIDVNAAAVAANAINAAAIADGAIDAATFAAGAISAAAIAANAITDAKIATGAFTAAKFAANALDAAALAADAAAEIAAAVAALVGSLVNHSGTAQAGATGTITLASGASAVDDWYAGCEITIETGTGAIQTRIITAYNGTSKVATVDRSWATAPDNTSTYTIRKTATAKLTSALGVTTTDADVMLANEIDDVSPTASQFKGTTALSSSNDEYNGAWCAFTSGVNAGQWRKISDYVGATRQLKFTGTGTDADAPFPNAPSDDDTFKIGGRA